MSTLHVYSKEGKKTEKTIDLPKEVFKTPVNTHVIHQAVLMYQAATRQGTASTKERGSVSGGGIKPWRQKGTGRARQGSIRSPLWHGGGVVFGPHPRDFSYSIPRSIKRAALRESLNAKFQSKQLTCMEDIKTDLKKTKEFVKILASFKLKGKVLAILDGSDDSITRVSRNIRSFNLVRAEDVNAFDILRNANLLVSKTAFDKLLKRIEK